MKVKMSLSTLEQREFNDSEKRVALLEQCKQIAEHPFVSRAEVYAGQMLLVELAPATHAQLASRLRDVDATILADLVDPNKNTDDVARGRLVTAIHKAATLFSVKELDGTVARGPDWKS